MKNKKHILQIVVNVIAVLSVIANIVTIIFPMAIDRYYNHEIHNEYLRTSSHDGDYIIVANEVGHSFMYGSSVAEIAVFESSNRLAYFRTYIKNNGASLSSNNCKIDWQDDYVKITTIDYNGDTEEVYRVYYDDYQ